MTVNKSIVVLTHLFASPDLISFSLTNGETTLKGATSSKKNLVLDIAYLAWELTNGSHTAKDLLAANPRENMKRYFRFGIDEEITHMLALHYKQNGEDAFIKTAEDIINLFDEVNGNTAVSKAIGIANLVQALQSEQSEVDTNPIPALIHTLYDLDPWNPENQGVTVLEGTDKDTGTKLEFTVVYAIGNAFVEGKIGSHSVRIFKEQNVQIYYGNQDHPYIFRDREKVIAYLKGILEAIVINN